MLRPLGTLGAARKALNRLPSAAVISKRPSSATVPVVNGAAGGRLSVGWHMGCP